MTWPGSEDSCRGAAEGKGWEGVGLVGDIILTRPVRPKRRTRSSGFPTCLMRSILNRFHFATAMKMTTPHHPEMTWWPEGWKSKACGWFFHPSFPLTQIHLPLQINLISKKKFNQLESIETRRETHGRVRQFRNLHGDKSKSCAGLQVWTF